MPELRCQSCLPENLCNLFDASSMILQGKVFSLTLALSRRERGQTRNNQTSEVSKISEVFAHYLLTFLLAFIIVIPTTSSPS